MKETFNEVILLFETNIIIIFCGWILISQMLLQVYSSSLFLTPDIFRPLYMGIVRNNLEYAVPVWNAYHKTLIDKIESVQERATKTIPGIRAKSYEERLRILKLPTLKYRRIRGDMINTFQILNGYP